MSDHARVPTTHEHYIADIVCRFRSPQLQAALDSFRIDYETQFGQVDLTRRYTSTLPSEQQEWLFRTDPRRYWSGLPPFVQAFFKAQLRAARAHGNMDDMPPTLVRLYLEGSLDDN